MGVQWQLFVTRGLGDNSYLLYSEDEAVIVDPQRDAWRFLDFADSKKLKIRYVLETHVHNDYVSGSLEVQAATGAKVAAPARGNYKFDHLKMSEGLDLRVGTARIVCWETPGHTLDHVSWLVFDEEENEEPLALFSGGSLLVGGAGRTDLLGDQWTQELTRSQYQSIQRIKTLPASLTVLPTHGAGSFCAAGSERKERVSTIENELKQNRLLLASSEALFAQNRLANLPAVPSYYAHMAPINRNGPSVLKSLPDIPAIHPMEVKESHAWIVDMRDRKSFAEAHIPGSINIEMDESFATYVGWVVPFGAGIILIADRENHKEAVTQLIRIGYENIRGHLKNGIDDWMTSGETIRSYPAGSIQDLCADYNAGRLRLIDVRQKSEWETGHAKESVHAFVGDLQQQTPPLSDEQWSIACVSGFRSAIAASILDARGVAVRLISEEGVPEFLSLCPEAKAPLNGTDQS